MRSYSTLVVGSGTLLLLVVVAAVLLVLAGRGPRSDVLAVVRLSATAAPATGTPAPQPPTTRAPSSSPTSVPFSVATAPAAAPPVEPPVGEQPPALPVEERFDYNVADEVLGLINAERAAGGLSALVANAALTASAQGYARTLLQLNVLSHNADGTDLLRRVRAAGYAGGPPLGEALWRSTGSYSAGQVVTGWLGSAAHAAILLGPAYREAGVGCYVQQSGDGVDMRCVLDVAG